jgi:DNA primase
MGVSYKIFAKSNNIKSYTTMNYNNIDFSTLDILVCVDYYGLSCKKSTENRYVLTCCFHNERTPSLNLYLQNNRFHCFGCGASGNVVNFVMQMENIDFIPALQVIRKIYDLDTTLSISKHHQNHTLAKKISPPPKEVKINKDFHYLYNDILDFCSIVGNANKQAINYLLNERYLQPYYLKQACIKTCNGLKLENYLRNKYERGILLEAGLWNDYDKFRYTKYSIIIPYYQDSKIKNLQFRTLQPNQKFKYMYLNGIPTIPYNTDNLTFLGKDDKVAITEGVLDCLTIYTMNEFLPAEQRFSAAIALPSATVISRELFAALQSQNLVISCFIDKDKAGSEAKEKIRQITKELDYKIDFRLLNDCKDVNEFYVKLISQTQ